MRSLFFTPDLDDPARTERTISRLRVALAYAAILALLLDFRRSPVYAPFAFGGLVAYLVVATAFMLARPGTPRSGRRAGLLSHVIDILACAAVTIATQGADTAFFMFLPFPLLTAAFRWGTAETLLTAGATLGALTLETFLGASRLPFWPQVAATDVSVRLLIIRASYVVALGLAVGYLASKERRVRHESMAISELIRTARLDAGLAGTLHGLMASISRTFEASRTLLVVREEGAARTFLLDARTDGRHASVTSSEIADADRDVYLFKAPGQSWYAVGLSPQDTTSITALDARGSAVPDATLDVPDLFLARHPCRSLLAVDIDIDTGWSGRLLVLNPRVGLDRDSSVRFAQRLVRDIAPVVRQTSVIHRLRRRAEALERGRLARELHDGPIQTLSAAALQLDLMQRRPDVSVDTLSELQAVASLLRDEVAGMREMTQDMRLAFIEPDSPDLVRDLADMVERFGLQQSIEARFITDETSVPVPQHVHRELLRAVHEALVNVRKHSGATELLVWLRVYADRLVLSIDDNGRGFGFTGRLTHAALEQQRLGPVVARERVAAVGGTLTVESRPGFGARLEFRLPLSPDARPASGVR